MQPPTNPKKSKRTVIIIIVVALVALTIPCIGCVAAIAIPAWINYIKKAKAAEAEVNLRALYTGASAYYEEERIGSGGEMLSGCTVDSAITPTAPGDQKYVLSDAPPSFRALGFEPPDPLYFQYEIVSSGGCSHPTGSEVYSFRAYGDLDADGTRSLYELKARVDGNGRLERSPSVYMENELE